MRRLALQRPSDSFILTANAYRRTLPFVHDEHTKTNLSYALMALDLLRWLAVRTDLTGTALEMLIKEAAFVTFPVSLRAIRALSALKI